MKSKKINDNIVPYTMIQGYEKLFNLLPLTTPLSIFIDPCNLCNFKCTFCPTSDQELLKSINRPRGMMNYDLFCKIINDIGQFDNRVRKLHLYKDGEPLLNPDLCRMIKYAKQKDIADSVETTTNGSLLNEAKSIEIIESGLDVIRISVEHVSDKGYKAITKTFSDYKTIRKNLKFLFKEKERRKSQLKMHTKILDVKLSNNEKEKFLEDFSPYSDSVNIDTLMGWSFSEKKEFTLGVKVNTGMDSKSILKKERRICPEPFKSLCVNFNGEVSVCCVDWSHGTVIGNANEESLINIWNGKKLQQFRKIHLKNKRETIPVCSNCHYLQGMQELKDLDNYADELNKIYS